MCCIRKQLALKIILCIAIAGALFSGYLSYTEIFKQTCALGAGTCTDVFAVPACVYGFVMYLILICVACCGLKSKK